MNTERGDYQVPGWLSQLESSAQRAATDRPCPPHLRPHQAPEAAALARGGGQ